MKTKIGIFGGLFDPVHNGHIQMALCAKDAADLDEVIFVPNGQPPHKTGDRACATDRFNMLLKATDNIECLSVSDYELGGEEYHYTVNTLRHFKKVYPHAQIYFVLGADSLDYIDKWKDAKNLIEENSFIVIDRHFKENYSIEENISKVISLGGKVIKGNMPFADISSTDVRNAISNGEDFESLVPKGVAEFIKAKKLYIGENHDNR